MLIVTVWKRRRCSATETRSVVTGGAGRRSGFRLCRRSEPQSSQSKPHTQSPRTFCIVHHKSITPARTDCAANEHVAFGGLFEWLRSINDRPQNQAALTGATNTGSARPTHGDVARLSDEIRRRSALDAYRAAAPALEDRLCTFRRICEPIAFAHSRGIIRSDIKPENVMIGAFGELLVPESGLAGRLDAATPTAAGTRGYMASEQGNWVTDVRTDIYSLGKVLEFLLDDTGNPSALRAVVCKAAHRYPQSDIRQQRTLLPTLPATSMASGFSRIANQYSNWRIVGSPAKKPRLVDPYPPARAQRFFCSYGIKGFRVSAV